MQGTTPKLARRSPQTRRVANASVRFQIGRDSRTTGDPRFLRAYCDGCGGEIKQKADKCPKCGASLRWKKKISCKFCADPPTVELAEGQSKVGFCAICGGTSKNPKFDPTVRLPFGMSSDASGSRGEQCPGCMGSGRCQWCEGTGWMTTPDYFGSN